MACHAKQGYTVLKKKIKFKLETKKSMIFMIKNFFIFIQKIIIQKIKNQTLSSQYCTPHNVPNILVKEYLF